MPTTNPKQQEAAASLPDELKPVFQRFVEEHEYLTNIHYGRGYVAYKVLANLISAGWRPSGTPLTGSKL